MLVKGVNQTFFKKNARLNYEISKAQEKRSDNLESQDFFSKIPNSYYLSKINFKGKDFHPINSTRDPIKYDKIYFGPLQGPIDENDQESRIRTKSPYENFSGKNLSYYIFKKSCFRQSDFKKANVSYTNFEDCNLFNSSFVGAKTHHTNFNYANLANTDFTNAKFGKQTSMLSANLMGANLSGTLLSRVDLTGALYNSATIFPFGFNPKEKGMICLNNGTDHSIPPKKEGEYEIYSWKKEKFERKKIRHLTIENVKFDNNSFKRADLKRWECNDCSFKNVDFTRAYAKEMIAENCDFSGAKMKQINFDQAKFKNVDMRNTDLRGAIFTFKTAENLDLTGAKYDQFTHFNDDFNPRLEGMIFEESAPSVYGYKE